VPCVIDIKMGTQTFEPTASAEKKGRELTKYAFQKEVGFRITGFKTFTFSDSGNSASTGTVASPASVPGEYKTVEKKYGRSLHPDDVQDALASFFNNGRCIRRDVIAVVIAKLDALLRWFTCQVNYHFYCSSILIVFEASECTGLWHKYDCDAQANSSIDTNMEAHAAPARSTMNDHRDWSSKPMSASELAEVKMIDFAHTLSNTDKVVDEGYVHGLRTLIAHLQSLLDKP